MHQDIQQVLQDNFGYSSFLSGQQEIIEKILTGSDVVGVMPTGSGKSLCFQIPSLVLKGTTIVISPLISLMKDQVDTLNDEGIRAAFINSSLTLEELRRISGQARRGRYKLLYIAPERLELDGFRDLLSGIDVSLLAVDEAHCISQWGHNFRPSYMKITSILNSLPYRPPVAAFTATATPQVLTDIVDHLALKQPYILINGFDRPNLYFAVNEPADKFTHLSEFIHKNRDHAGIVYCSTRKTVENVCERLNRLGCPATRYHAGLSDSERITNQEDFLYDRKPVIVATNAFGMGIDKSNIRFVVHYNMPKTMENYYQEAGRAGRDGVPSQCILLYSAADIITNKYLITNSNGEGENHNAANDYKKLQQIIDYCNITGCLRKYILRYFGEKETRDTCDHCGNCLNEVAKSEITIEAQKILSCIYRMGENFGSTLVADVLRGSGAARIKNLGFDNLSTYGIMKDYSAKNIKSIIAVLIAEGLLEVTGDNYPVLKLNSASLSFLKNKEPLYVKKVIVKEETPQQKARRKDVIEHPALFEELRKLRKTIAGEQGVPPFVVFSDATLKDICRIIPVNSTAMLAVSGVGNHKLEKYGERFMQVISNYATENNLEEVNIIPRHPTGRSRG